MSENSVLPASSTGDNPWAAQIVAPQELDISKGGETTPEPEKAPTEPVEAAPEPSDDAPKKEPKPDTTDRDEKAYITREKNRRKTVEAALAATQEQNAKLMEMLQRFVPDPSAAKSEPKRDAYEDVDTYVEARSEWLAEQKVGRLSKEQQQRAQAQEAQRVASEHAERLAQAEEKYPGIADVAKDPTLPVSDAMGAAILTSDVGPDILHFLDEHRTEAKRIFGLTPARAAAEIGKIEAALSAPVAPKVSSAPKPIKPIGAASSMSKKLEDMSMEEYAAHRARERRAELGLG